MTFVDVVFLGAVILLAALLVLGKMALNNLISRRPPTEDKNGINKGYDMK